MEKCNLCPRLCGVDRSSGKGACGVGSTSYVARSALHMWEEPFISGKNGSGTIFFCGCNLRCIFCQNHEISSDSGFDGAVPADENTLRDMMLSLERAGAENINFVTPTPHTPLICKAISLARKAGLAIPTAFNTNSYIMPETLDMLNGLIDIYMPDLKYVTPQAAGLLSGAENYPQYAKAAIKKMFEQCGTMQFNENGMATRGVVIRHLVLPGNIDETRRVLDYIKENFPLNIHISLMSQYFPAKAGLPEPLNRKLLKREYRRAVEYAQSLGFTNLLTQELTAATQDYVPQWGEFEIL